MIKNDNDELFLASRQWEYDEIVWKGGLKIVDCADLPTNANLVDNWLLLCIKDTDSSNQKFKTHSALQGHHDCRHHKISYYLPILMLLTLQII